MSETEKPGRWRREVLARLPWVAAAVACGGLAFAARYGFEDWWSRKYWGVTLWATMIYFWLRAALPAVAVWRLALVAVAGCWLVEFAQLTWVPAYLSSRHLLLRFIFGATFNPPDLAAYAVGVLLGLILTITARAYFKSGQA
jgi:hypothetical protein